MFVDTLAAVGSWLIFLAACLQMNEALVKSWAWLEVAADEDAENYQAATSGSWSEHPLTRAINGLTDPSHLPWIPQSAQLAQYNARAWAWTVLASGSLAMAMSASARTAGRANISSTIVGIFGLVMLVVCVVIATYANKQARREELRNAHDTLRAHVDNSYEN